jgi:geranylgeranyl pyrophosphate synthase
VPDVYQVAVAVLMDLLLIKILDETGAILAASQRAREYTESAGKALLALPVTASRNRLARYAQLAIDRDS